MFADIVDGGGDELLDDDDVGPPLLLAPPLRPDLRPAAPDHHRRGEAQRPIAKLKFKLASVTRLAAQWKTRAVHAAETGMLAFSRHVSQVCFGRCSPDDHKVLQMASGESLDVPLSHQGRRSDDYKSCLDFGLASAVRAQAEGLATLIADTSTRKVDHIISVCTADDASMWVKDPATKADRKSGRRCEGSKVDGKLWKRGNTVHLGVCNQCEDLFCRSHVALTGDSNIRGACIHVPAQVLVEANTATIRNRLTRWLSLSPSGPGETLDPDGILGRAQTSQNSWKTCVFCLDNLSLNQNIMAMEERAITMALVTGLEDESSVTTHLSLSCRGHSVVLSTKQVTDRCGDYPGSMCRMGHLHESGKISHDHRMICKELVKKRFLFFPVAELQAEAPRWEAHARHILRVTRGARDLTPEDEDFIVHIDNGCWANKSWEHYCLGPERCLAMCGGDPAKALQLMLDAQELSIGGPPQAPLKYRWKGVEQFASKLYRAHRQHNLWIDSHRALWPPSQVLRAQHAIDQLGGDDNVVDNNDTLRYKQQIRGGKTVAFLERDPHARTLEKLMILNTGVQYYLNHCFAADALVTKYTLRLQMIDEYVAVADEDLLELRAKCIKNNLSIVSGQSACTMMDMYSEYFIFDAEVWDDWDTDNSDAKYDTCLDLICVMQDAHHRLIFASGVPKLAVFDVCEVPEGDGFDDSKVQEIARRFRILISTCDRCVDAVFTKVWVARLLDFGSSARRQAHRALCDILSVLRTVTTLVEKKHLLGMELKPKKRGSALECATLGRAVFKACVTRSAEVHRAQAKLNCCGGDPEVVKRLMHNLTRHNISGHSDRRSEVRKRQRADGEGDAAEKICRCL
jgi:hypothetical protein